MDINPLYVVGAAGVFTTVISYAWKKAKETSDERHSEPAELRQPQQVLDGPTAWQLEAIAAASGYAVGEVWDVYHEIAAANETERLAAVHNLAVTSGQLRLEKIFVPAAVKRGA